MIGTGTGNPCWANLHLFPRFPSEAIGWFDALKWDTLPFFEAKGPMIAGPENHVPIQDIHPRIAINGAVVPIYGAWQTHFFVENEL